MGPALISDYMTLKMASLHFSEAPLFIIQHIVISQHSQKVQKFSKS